MNEIMQLLENTFTPLVFIFTVTNLFNMGIQVKIDGVLAVLKKKKVIALIFVWSWVLGPALAYLIAWILPLSEPFVIGLLLSSLAPVTPFLPLTVEKARGDMNFAGALIPLVMVGTVIFMPLLAPLMIKGVTVSARSIAEPLLLSVLLPLAIGIGARHYMELVAKKIFPAVNIIAKISTIAVAIWGVVIFTQPMIETAGSFGLLSAILFMILIALITYFLGFGLKQSQRSVMSLGMLTRNGGPVLIAALAIPSYDNLILTFVILLNVGGLVLSPITARIFGKLAGKTDVELSQQNGDKI
jgi:BASS family bile acid:Na+ symporter